MRSGEGHLAHLESTSVVVEILFEGCPHEQRVFMRNDHGAMHAEQHRCFILHNFLFLFACFLL